MHRIKVGIQGIRVGIWGIRVGMQGIRVGMRGTEILDSCFTKILIDKISLIIFLKLRKS